MMDNLKRAHEILEYELGDNIPNASKVQIAGAMWYLEKDMREREEFMMEYKKLKTERESSRNAYVVLYIDHEDGNVDCTMYGKEEDALNEIKEEFEREEKTLRDGETIQVERDSAGRIDYFGVYEDDELVYECCLRDGVI